MLVGARMRRFKGAMTWQLAWEWVVASVGCFLLLYGGLRNDLPVYGAGAVLALVEVVRLRPEVLRAGGGDE